MQKLNTDGVLEKVCSSVRSFLKKIDQAGESAPLTPIFSVHTPGRQAVEWSDIDGAISAALSTSRPPLALRQVCSLPIKLNHIKPNHITT
jgi:hypothetical protein